MSKSNIVPNPFDFFLIDFILPEITVETSAHTFPLQASTGTKPPRGAWSALKPKQNGSLQSSRTKEDLTRPNEDEKPSAAQIADSTFKSPPLEPGDGGV